MKNRNKTEDFDPKNILRLYILHAYIMELRASLQRLRCRKDCWLCNKKNG